jgi:hypothetical protein
MEPPGPSTPTASAAARADHYTPGLRPLPKRRLLYSFALLLAVLQVSVARLRCPKWEAGQERKWQGNVLRAGRARACGGRGLTLRGVGGTRLRGGPGRPQQGSLEGSMVG